MHACKKVNKRHKEGIDANNNMMSKLGSKQSASSCYSPSSSMAIARTFRNCEGDTGGHVAGWSMSSLLTALPESPSPVCSRASLPTHTSHSRYQDYATEFSPPRNQSLGIARYDSNDVSNCFSDIDEWLEHANKFCKPSNSHTCNHFTESADMRRNTSPEEDLRISAICSAFLTAPEDELYNITLPSIRERSPRAVLQGQTRFSCMHGESNERRSLLSRTEPYDELWNEAIRRKKHQARNKAKHDELVNRMRRKEDAIDNWELQQTRKAMDEMDKIQNKLERKQVIASARTQKKISLVRDKAEKQKLNLRRHTMKRFRQLQISDTQSPTTTTTTPTRSSCRSRFPISLC